jgi:membrane-associated phospholipid phosphatase
MCSEALTQRGKSLLLTLLCLAVATGASAQTTQAGAPLLDAVSAVSLDGASDAWQNVDFGQQEQQQKPEGRSLVRDIVGDFGRFFTRRENYAIMAMGLGGSFSFRPLDELIASSAFNPEIGLNGGTKIDAVFEPGAVLGGMAVQLGGAFATYGFGKWLDKPGMAAFGRDLVRAQVLTQGVTHLMKRVVRRTRPDESNKKSFPSGHTSGAFATATVFQRHYGWKAGLPAFSLAGYIAASRVNENRHFLSDVIFGAAVGLAAGHTVTFGRGRTVFELAPLAAPGGGGIHVTISRDR